MSKVVAILPYYGGTSEEAHSAKELRLGYLKETIAQLEKLGIDWHVYIQNSDDDAELTKENIAHTIVRCEPKFLPYTVAQAVKKIVEDDEVVLFTEADQIYSIEQGVYAKLTDNNFYTPMRMEELCGDVGQDRGLVVELKGKRYVIPNFFSHDAQVRTFGGGFMCKGSAFKKIDFKKSDQLAVEHITGFSAHLSGLTYMWDKSFSCIHLSGYEFHKKLAEKK